MSVAIIQKIEEDQMKKEFPRLHVGDTVRVSRYIVEGKKKRIQHSEGHIIKIVGAYSRQNFTLRRNVGGVGVEQTFLIHSPLVTEIKVIKQAIVRRAKLYYLRGRIGAKANRLKAKK